MTQTIAQFVGEKRANFARFIIENTNDSVKAQVQKSIDKMVAFDAILFLQTLKLLSAGKTENEMIKGLLDEVGLSENDFNSEARGKFLQYLRMFLEIANQ